MPLIDLSLVNFGFVLQLGKIVASIEQKPVSLNDILWRVELLSRMKAIFEWALVIDCNCQSVEDDSCKKAFWLLLMIFCYLCQCFCIVKYILSKSWMFLCFSFWMGNAYYESNLSVISFSWSKRLWLIWVLKLVTCSGIFFVKEL